ncbi:E3 ubiquitin-protein ligase MBR2 isoform X2 [Abrus precatorius]|nr:E3 ubiquitin-protein ligase MBR2 isoform X2 [Abrus precatorius]XP_027345786.1 E3 ubiquitin-protein ligase MBR2 isoform X2 [Abrus precatorius]XP_027345787.1 E3 ubiquitin-protein ligase MBR2 isoform X2 [Abrus precatorius]
MQGQRRTVGSFPAIVSMMQGPNSSGTDMNHQSSLNHVQNAVDFRLSDYRGSSGDAACLRGTGPNVQSFSGWNPGEPSSRLNMINQVNDDGLKSEHGLSSSYSAATEDGLRSEERQFEPNNAIFPVSNLHGNQSRSHPSFLQGSSSNHINQNISLNTGHIANAADRGKGKEAGGSVNDNNTSGSDKEKTSFVSASCTHIGTSSESSGYMAWGDCASSSSLVNWGPSCKRKALEGSSRQLSTGGSSSSLVQSENDCWPTDPVDLNASTSLSDSTPSEDIPVTAAPLQQNTINEVRQEPSNAFPLISVAENVERPLRNFDRRMTQIQRQESVPLNLPSAGSARHHNHSSLHQIPGSNSFNDSLELRLTAGVTAANSGGALNPSPALRMHPFPWNRPTNQRGARSSTSYNSGERAVREDFNLRIFPRDNTEHPMNLPESSGHEPTAWHTSSGIVNNSGGVPPTSWIGSSSNVHSSPNPSWIFNHEVPTENLQRVSEFSPWSFFPSISSASGVHNGHSTPSPSGPPSFTQGSSSNQPYLRTALLMERRGGDVLSAPHSLRALTFDNEGRRRLISEIRQVLIAMRRGENLRAEDYMLFDPFLYHGMAEMHDRHREMRLDVDNMSYEELLALEERIGDVSTGLSEDTIVKLMKQRLFMSVMTESSTDLEPCCICQEEYADGENVGSLDCGHEFHSECIKQWLLQKNLCPICKTTALAT